MEFPFSINNLLLEPITRIDDKMAPFRGMRHLNRLELMSKQTQLKKLIDRMGEASAKAQSLRSPITTAMKLQCSEHRLYILKDSTSNSGAGVVVGILKVGRKKLFVLDLYGVQNEVHPLCVLDFYVHESCQRKGYGKALFQFMLKMENIQPAQLAIDRPSRKFISFIKKHYQLSNPVPQVNNFVVFEQFFKDLQAVGFVPKRSNHQTKNSSNGRPPLHPYRRPSEQSDDFQKHQSSGRTSSRLNSADLVSRRLDSPADLPVILGDEALKAINLPTLVPRPPSMYSRQSSAGQREMQEAGRPQSTVRGTLEANNTARAMGARATCYSRHTLSREGSAENTRRQSAGSADTRSAQVHSGGRVRSLHVTSTDNPFMTSGTKQAVNKCPVEDVKTPDVGLSNTASRPSYLSPSGNYSISAVYNSHFGPKSFLGTSWNVLGVPSVNHTQQNKKQNETRSYPF